MIEAANAVGATAAPHVRWSGTPRNPWPLQPAALQCDWKVKYASQCSEAARRRYSGGKTGTNSGFYVTVSAIITPMSEAGRQISVKNGISFAQSIYITAR